MKKAVKRAIFVCSSSPFPCRSSLPVQTLFSQRLVNTSDNGRSRSKEQLNVNSSPGIPSALTYLRRDEKLVIGVTSFSSP